MDQEVSVLGNHTEGLKVSAADRDAKVDTSAVDMDLIAAVVSELGAWSRSAEVCKLGAV